MPSFDDGTFCRLGRVCISDVTLGWGVTVLTQHLIWLQIGSGSRSPLLTRVLRGLMGKIMAASAQYYWPRMVFPQSLYVQFQLMS